MFTLCLERKKLWTLIHFQDSGASALSRCDGLAVHTHPPGTKLTHRFIWSLSKGLEANHPQPLIQSQMGVCHADDLFYLFDPIFGFPPDLLTGEVLNDKYSPLGSCSAENKMLHC